MKTMRGFSLIELMVALTIFGIVAAWAAPAFREMIANSRQLTIGNNFVASFQLARVEAATRSINTVVKAVGYCDTNGYLTGWRVETLPAANYDGNDTPCKATPDEAPTVLSRHEALPSGFTVAQSTANVIFGFNPQGRLIIYTDAGNVTAPAAAVTITVCDNRTAELGRRITVEPIGRVSVAHFKCT